MSSLRNKYLIFSCYILFYSVLFFFISYIHNRYFTVDVVFFDAILDAVISGIFALALLFACFHSFFARFDFFSIGIITMLFGYSMAISIPTVIDRSLSFYIIEQINSNGGSVYDSDLKNIVNNDYFHDHHVYDIRLTEQLESGTVKNNGKCIALTRKGYFVSSFSKFYRANFLPERRLLSGTYTDALKLSNQKVDRYPNCLEIQ